MDKAKQARFRQRLMEEWHHLTAQEQDNQRFGLDESFNQSISELSGYDNHPADLGTEMFERGKDLALQDANHRRLQEIEAAVARLDAGEYGRCEVCKEPIDEERLDAVPWARTCIDHNPNPDLSANRPIEEKVIAPFRRSRDNSYDREDAWQEVERYGTSNPPDFFSDGESYQELTIHDDEQRGYVDLTEGFAITDLSGETEEITEITHNDAYQEKDVD